MIHPWTPMDTNESSDRCLPFSSFVSIGVHSWNRISIPDGRKVRMLGEGRRKVQRSDREGLLEAS